jgi:hypothetical protein
MAISAREIWGFDTILDRLEQPWKRQPTNS